MVSSVEMVIAPRRRSIGSDTVDRLLPYRDRRTVGPFIYADLIGPSPLPPGAGVDVAAHPHIGLATVTYLFAGALMHRDSTGAVQRIDPGAVNWMTAGRGVAHSERSPGDERAAASSIAGLQTWVALPEQFERDEPSFTHVAGADVPEWVDGIATVRLVAGTFDGRTSEVPVMSPLVHADVRFAGPGEWALAPVDGEVGVLVVEGHVAVGDVEVASHHLAVLGAGGATVVVGDGVARVVVLGGQPVGPRIIDWNFVASDPALIEAARAAWRSGDWPEVPGDPERVPLP